MTDEHAVLAEAAGYFSLGLYDVASELVNSQPDSIRRTPVVMMMRVACAIALSEFQTAETLSLKLSNGPEKQREFAARVLHELAAIHHLIGNGIRARELIHHAIRIHPAQRTAILEDHQLEALVGETTTHSQVGSSNCQEDQVSNDFT